MEEFERETQEEIRWLDGVSKGIQNDETESTMTFIQMIAQVIKERT